MLYKSLFCFIGVNRAVNGCHGAQKAGGKSRSHQKLIKGGKQIDYGIAEKYLPTLWHLTAYYAAYHYYNTANLSEGLLHMHLPFSCKAVRYGSF